MWSSGWINKDPLQRSCTDLSLSHWAHCYQPACVDSLLPNVKENLEGSFSLIILFSRMKYMNRLDGREQRATVSGLLSWIRHLVQSSLAWINDIDWCGGSSPQQGLWFLSLWASQFPSIWICFLLPDNPSSSIPACPILFMMLSFPDICCSLLELCHHQESQTL